MATTTTKTKAPATKKPTAAEMKHDTDMVQRKLAGIFEEVQLTIEWNTFDSYCDLLRETLSDEWGIKLTRQEIIANPETSKRFSKRLNEYFKQDIEDNLIDCIADDSYDDADFIFSQTIQDKEDEDARIAEEERQRVLREQMAKKAEQEALRVANPGSYIEISEKNVAKAKAILKAAGLIK